uniref:Apovitellenin-1 n=1 Tax=Malurus cyaneus samueli TaxID=2593467 RepID=A0A8C5TCV4_9PASS
MLQSRALVIALILLLTTTPPEVQSKSLFEKDRRDLLAIPETIASYIYETVNKVSPKVSQFLLDTVQSPSVIAARYGKLLCTNTQPCGIREREEWEKEGINQISIWGVLGY